MQAYDISMEKEICILLFYKYIFIKYPEKLKKKHLAFCQKLGIRGRILLAHEGINGSVSGTRKQVEEYKKGLRKDSRFLGIMFKEDKGILHPFKRMEVKTKKEIVNFGQNVDLKNVGKHITPREFLDLYKNEEGKIGKDIIILDVRNEYESRVGKFNGAYISSIKTFREFTKVACELESKKDKKIVIYCTGGIRCEKASAYLKEQGFKDVSQLSGGILAFGKEFPDTIWQGKCFVFDKRIISSINSEESTITKCEICYIACDLYKNCRNNECDKFSSLCIECEKIFGGCCSEECFGRFLVENTN